jgi:hypothetical protein
VNYRLVSRYTNIGPNSGIFHTPAANTSVGDNIALRYSENSGSVELSYTPPTLPLDYEEKYIPVAGKFLGDIRVNNIDIFDLIDEIISIY